MFIFYEKCRIYISMNHMSSTNSLCRGDINTNHAWRPSYIDRIYSQFIVIYSHGVYDIDFWQEGCKCICVCFLSFPKQFALLLGGHFNCQPTKPNITTRYDKILWWHWFNLLMSCQQTIREPSKNRFRVLDITYSTLNVPPTQIGNPLAVLVFLFFFL